VPITRSIALTFLLFVPLGCASTPGDRASRETAKKPLEGGVAEFNVTTYDGRVLEGRFLLGATIDPLVIDGHMYENLNVELQEVRECGKKELLKHWAMEALHPPPRADELVTIDKGYWYGANLHFFLFDEKRTGPGPACFEAELVARAIGGRAAARLPIRVVRTDKLPAPTDGGTEEPNR
jgi:hypothetical protein